MLDGHPRAGVGADAGAERGLLQRHLAQAHGHRRGLCLGGVGVERDRRAFIEARALQPLLEVEQQGFGGRCAG
jgi:hypothetical protein